MTLEEVIKTDTAAIAPAYPLVIPSGAPDACIVYQLVSGVEFGASEYVLPRVMLKCYAKSYGAAVALANQVRALYYDRHVTVSGVHYRARVLNVYDLPPETDTGIYGRGVDVRFAYRNPTS